jgi:hypothetical protein
MRKLVLILIAFIAVVTFIRAFDNNNAGVNVGSFRSNLHSTETVSQEVE